MDACRSGHLTLAQHESHCGLIVGDGLRVRHRAHRGESTSGCCARASGNRLDVLSAGLTQMAMHIDESR
jgi:hypothetical protein